MEWHWWAKHRYFVAYFPSGLLKAIVWTICHLACKKNVWIGTYTQVKYFPSYKMALSVSEQREEELKVLEQKYYFFIQLTSPASLIIHLCSYSKLCLIKMTSSAYVCPYLALYYLTMFKNNLFFNYMLELMFVQARVKTLRFYFPNEHFKLHGFKIMVHQSWWWCHSKI